MGSVASFCNVCGDCDVLLPPINAVECFGAALDTEIQHAVCVFEGECPWNSHKIGADGEFVDSNERYDFTACADDEVGGRWLDFDGSHVVRIECHRGYSV